MKNLLLDTVKSGKLTAFYVDTEDSENFLVGTVVLAGESDIFAVLYDTKNLPEALCYCAIDAIYRIEQDSIYLQHILEHQHAECALLKFQETPWNSFFQTQRQYNNYVRCYLKSGQSIGGKIIQYSQDGVMLLQIKNNKETECVTHFRRSEVAMLTVDVANRGG